MQVGELALGILISFVTIAMQAVLTVLLGRSLQALSHRAVKERSVPTLILVMCYAGGALTFGHFLQVGVWATSYVVLGVAPLHDAYDLALQNFTTLGYGDLLPANGWRLLAPITSANGLLLFGWSTAFLYTVLNRAAQALHLF
ncbi:MULTISPECIES: ion channel [unclassified Xanthobacter]|uniref:ion channel n=1 Tax=unclassified Xanthobacter TaxID=2623496 RepID=UPI001EE082DD|nr:MULTISPECIES: ion channel [unclassified Xanthobacter]